MTTTTINLDGTELVSTREAARCVSLTHDYIARLAREERVVGMKVGRQWYVDLGSVRRFIAAAELEKSVRAEQLRAERQREQRAAQRTFAVGYQLLLGQRLQALAQAATVFSLGLLLGYVLFVANQATTFSQVVATAVKAVTEWPRVAFETSVAGTSTPVLRAQDVSTATPATIASVESRTSSLPDTPLVLLGESARESDEAYLQSLFSDPVLVEFVTPERGLVTPLLADGPGEPVEFLLVPNVHGGFELATP